MSKTDPYLRGVRKRHAEALSRFTEWRRLVLNDTAGLPAHSRDGRTPTGADRAAFRDLSGTAEALLDIELAASPRADADTWRAWMLTGRPALEAVSRLTPDAYVVSLDLGVDFTPPATDPDCVRIAQTYAGGVDAEAAQQVAADRGAILAALEEAGL